MENAIVVLDIGKTNKKLLVYSESLEILEFSYVKIDTIPYEELQVENSALLVDWLLENLKALSAKYRIKVISVSAHGATCACLGKDGTDPVLPVVAYTNEIPDSVREGFYALAGNRLDLQRRTATSEVRPMANLALLVYYLKTRFPDRFAGVGRILPYPQYIGAVLTGKDSADVTYVGCHTYLWDFAKWSWSSVVDALGIRRLLPDHPSRPGDILGRVSPSVVSATGLSPDTLVTVGIHDSNSSLLPYLVNSGESDFVLNSTGTWCVLMHPGERFGFSPEEIGKTVFFNISAEGNPVKTAIFMGGQELETWMKVLQARHRRADFIPFDSGAVRSIVAAKGLFVIPGVVPGAGQFPESVSAVVEDGERYSLEDVRSGARVPRSFSDYTVAYTAIVLSLVAQTSVALSRVNLRPGTRIFVEGGFRNNEAYLTLLASLFPHNSVFITRMDEATAFGAALLGKAAVDKKSLKELAPLCTIEKRRVYPKEIEGLEAYASAFLDAVAANGASSNGAAKSRNSEEKRSI